ncbi:MAG: family 20 glycosylhydrolase [Clostridia bacterium]|nr:family 20 glycosylhydrolase [Clostridia bacterium]
MTEKSFEHRGFMLDVCRHYMSVRNIKRLLDAAQICGMNRMHWHLTDDQGWRIQIKQYPLLTGVGAHRGQSYFGVFSGIENNDGFYTHREIREIVEYATERGIEIIPEIELPGHAGAMLASYPEMGCRRTVYSRDGERVIDRPYRSQVEVSAGIYPDLLCAGKDQSLQFIRNILDEVIELFPYDMVHIGGDEAIKLRWRRCPDCQARMKDLGIETEEELQRWLVLEVGRYLHSRGKKTVVWCDVLAGGPLPDYFVVQQWMGESEATRAHLASGGKVIVSDTQCYYLDYPYGVTDLHDVWQYPRIPSYAEGYESGILGLESPLWTEYVTSIDRAAFMLFPRMIGIGLKAAGEADTEWEPFHAKVAEKQKQIETLGLTGAPEEFWAMTPEQKAENRQLHDRQTRTPSIMPYVNFEQQLVLLEQAEKLMEAIGVPKAFAERAGDRILTKLYHGHFVTEDDGAGTLIEQLLIAVRNRQEGVWQRYPEEIWIETMKCFGRFIREYRECYGHDGFDRGHWTTRQINARLFRIGTLEYEMTKEEDGKVIRLHIPSDADLSAAALNQSVETAKTFFKTYLPDYADAPMRCESWLLSPVVREMLPDTARIVHFQNAFELESADPSSREAIQWVFHLTKEQQKTIDVSSLPEGTQLQKKMKAILLEGRDPGAADGKLVRPFE